MAQTHNTKMNTLDQHQEAGDNAAEIQSRINTLRIENRNLTYDRARNLVRSQSPELFGLPARDQQVQNRAPGRLPNPWG
jgi:hypothetical protein